MGDVDALFRAVKLEDYKFVERWCAANDPNVIDTKTPKRSTPLHWAAYSGSRETVNVLLRHGADINAVESDNKTALHLAAFEGHRAVVALLLKLRADWTVLDTPGKTACDLAIMNNHMDVARLFPNFKECAEHHGIQASDFHFDEDMWNTEGISPSNSRRGSEVGRTLSTAEERRARRQAFLRGEEVEQSSPLGVTVPMSRDEPISPIQAPQEVNGEPLPDDLGEEEPDHMDLVGRRHREKGGRKRDGELPELIRVQAGPVAYPVDGVYRLVEDGSWEGMPVWESYDATGGTACIYSGTNGLWIITEDIGNIRDNLGLVISHHEHGGIMPHQIPEGAWETYDGTKWMIDPAVSVTALPPGSKAKVEFGNARPLPREESRPTIDSFAPRGQGLQRLEDEEEQERWDMANQEEKARRRLSKRERNDYEDLLEELEEEGYHRRGGAAPKPKHGYDDFDEGDERRRKEKEERRRERDKIREERKVAKDRREKDRERHRDERDWDRRPRDIGGGDRHHHHHHHSRNGSDEWGEAHHKAAEDAAARALFEDDQYLKEKERRREERRAQRMLEKEERRQRRREERRRRKEDSLKQEKYENHRRYYPHDSQDRREAERSPKISWIKTSRPPTTPSRRRSRSRGRSHSRHSLRRSRSAASQKSHASHFSSPTRSVSRSSVRSRSSRRSRSRSRYDDEKPPWIPPGSCFATTKPHVATYFDDMETSLPGFYLDRHLRKMQTVNWNKHY